MLNIAIESQYDTGDAMATDCIPYMASRRYEISDDDSHHPHHQNDCILVIIISKMIGIVV